MEERDPTCGEARDLAERLIEGEIDAVGERTLRRHLGACPSCRAEFALDLALIKTIKASPEEVFETVSSEVMSRVSTRERRFWLLRWGLAVSGIASLGVVVNAFGLRVFEYLYGIVSGAGAARPEVTAVGKLRNILLLMFESLRAKLFDCAVGGNLCPYKAQILVLAIGSAALAIFMMYLMGLWLRKPREVRL